jgi:hypothetical protein
MLIFIEKESNRVALYGSIEALTEKEYDFVKKKSQYFYKQKQGVKVFDFDLEDFENEFCRVCKREVIRKEHAKSNFL